MLCAASFGCQGEHREGWGFTVKDAKKSPFTVKDMKKKPWTRGITAKGVKDTKNPPHI
jgi:hypothetical protein